MCRLFDSLKGSRGIYFCLEEYAPWEGVQIIFDYSKGSRVVYFCLEEYTPLGRCADYF